MRVGAGKEEEVDFVEMFDSLVNHLEKMIGKYLKQRSLLSDKGTQDDSAAAQISESSDQKPHKVFGKARQAIVSAKHGVGQRRGQSAVFLKNMIDFYRGQGEASPGSKPALLYRLLLLFSIFLNNTVENKSEIGSLGKSKLLQAIREAFYLVFPKLKPKKDGAMKDALDIIVQYCGGILSDIERKNDGTIYINHTLKNLMQQIGLFIRTPLLKEHQRLHNEVKISQALELAESLLKARTTDDIIKWLKQVPQAVSLSRSLGDNARSREMEDALTLLVEYVITKIVLSNDMFSFSFEQKSDVIDAFVLSSPGKYTVCILPIIYLLDNLGQFHGSRGNFLPEQIASVTEVFDYIFQARQGIIPKEYIREHAVVLRRAFINIVSLHDQYRTFVPELELQYKTVISYAHIFNVFVTEDAPQTESTFFPVQPILFYQAGNELDLDLKLLKNAGLEPDTSSVNDQKATILRHVSTRRRRARTLFKSDFGGSGSTSDFTFGFEAGVIRVIVNTMKETSCEGLYFEADYQILNSLVADIRRGKPGLFDGLAEELPADNIIKRVLSDRGKADLYDKLSAHEDDVAQELVDFSEDFLPEDYHGVREGTFYSDPERKFPSSEIGCLLDEGWFAHHDQQIIAAAGPIFDKPTLWSPFLSMIANNNVAQVLSLGESPDDFNSYTSVSGPVVVDGYTIAVEEVDNPSHAYYAHRLEIKSQEGITHSSYLTNIPVTDNIPLNFSFQAAQAFLGVYNNATLTSPVVVHCASGVGRTGQVRLLFRALDVIKSDSRFRNAIDTLLKTGLIVEDEQKYVSSAIRQMAFKLRKIRYALQVESQYTGSFEQLLLLRATQLGCNNEAYCKLQEALGVNNLHQHNVNFGLDAHVNLSLGADQRKLGDIIDDVAGFSGSGGAAGAIGSIRQGTRPTSLKVDSPLVKGSSVSLFGEPTGGSRAEKTITDATSETTDPVKLSARLFTSEPVSPLAALLLQSKKQIPQPGQVQLIFETEEEAEDCQRQLKTETQSHSAEAGAASSPTNFVIEAVTMLDEDEAGSSASSTVAALRKSFVITVSKGLFNQVLRGANAYDELVENLRVMQQHKP